MTVYERLVALGVGDCEIVGSIAEFERALIRERTVAGMHAAHRRGVHCGRRRALAAAQVELARLALTAPDASIAHVARRLRVGRATLYRELSAAGKAPGPAEHYAQAAATEALT